MACPTVTILRDGEDPLVIDDGVTEGANGIFYRYEDLAGWWDSGPVRTAQQESQTSGEVITAAHELARPLVLSFLAVTATPNSTKLGEALCFQSIYDVKFVLRAVYVPVLMTVVDPVITSHALVRRVGAGVKCRTLGENHSVLFQVQLLSEDPRRYDVDDDPHD